MNRTVVSFERLGADVLVKLAEAPGNVPGTGDNELADISPVDGLSAVDRGTLLHQRLTSHVAVRAGLEAVLTLPPAAAPSPLYFHIRAAAADDLPWEQLYVPPDGFCALDDRWPVGRIARVRRPLTLRLFDPPLTVVAVLSAAGRSGTTQLRTLLAVAASADAAAVDVRVHVISGDEDVLEIVRSAGQPGVTCDLLAPTGPGLAQQVREAQPQILHLLCHGEAVAGVRNLAFASLADFDAGEERGSVRLTVADLVSAVLPADPWLVVLAACDTAESVAGPALAHDVASQGVPAVVGMRRLVDLGDMERFCAAFYPEVLRAVRQAVDPATGPGERAVEWVTALTGPRKVMAAPNPASTDVWSDPVLYVQNDPLRVLRPAPTVSTRSLAALQGELDTWQGILDRLDPTTCPPHLLLEVVARVGDLRARIAQASE